MNGRLTYPGPALLAGFIGAMLALGTGLAEARTGEEIFATYCASCHGAAGHPDPDSPVVEALGVVPADFADALFNSREPLSDWRLVVTYGGPSLGFSEKMAAFGEVLSDEEIDAVLDYVKTLGGVHDYPDGSLNLYLPVRTKKAFPEDEWVWKQRHTDRDGANVWKNTLEYEFRIGQRFQGVLEMSHERDSDGDTSWGHFEPGWKYVLAHDRRAGFIATFGGNLGVPVEGGDHWEFLPYVAVGKVLGDSLTAQGSARLKLDLEDSDAGSGELAGVVHWTHSDWPRNVFPALEVVAEIPFDRGVGPDREAAVQWSAVPQARIGLNRRGHVALNVAVEVPLNERDRYDWQAYVYLIWDFADGGFFEGW